MTYKLIVFSNVMQSLRAILGGMEKLGMKFQDCDREVSTFHLILYTKYIVIECCSVVKVYIMTFICRKEATGVVSLLITEILIFAKVFNFSDLVCI